ncbi:MAG: hypothetical protein WDA00_06385 [Eubacteriales bacterium]
MFHLVKIEYGRHNVPEPQRLPATADVAYQNGMCLYLDTTTHTLNVAEGDVTVEYICLENTVGEAGGMVLCYRVYPQMLFETSAEEYSDTCHSVGDRAQIAVGGLGLAAEVVEDNFGAQVVSTEADSEEGRRILVRLA